MRHLIAVLTLLALTDPHALRAQAPAPAPAPRPSPSPQLRPHTARIAVDPRLVQVDDGDTVVIRWGATDTETIRILGIDTPETRHVEHDLPYDQPFGVEAQAFARGAFAAANRIELRRSTTLDPFGRSLGYLWIDGRNYSVLVVTARLAEESITRYGDNGLPQEASEVLAAARQAGPLPFESPAAFRGRMRDVSRWMKEQGLYPQH
jgi:endonuclease YncB( thermonuclease family)